MRTLKPRKRSTGVEFHPLGIHDKPDECSNCGKPGSHFVGPSFGEEGFFACKTKDSNGTNSEDTH